MSKKSKSSKNARKHERSPSINTRGTGKSRSPRGRETSKYPRENYHRAHPNSQRKHEKEATDAEIERRRKQRERDIRKRDEEKRRQNLSKIQARAPRGDKDFADAEIERRRRQRERDIQKRDEERRRENFNKPRGRAPPEMHEKYPEPLPYPRHRYGSPEKRPARAEISHPTVSRDESKYRSEFEEQLASLQINKEPLFTQSRSEKDSKYEGASILELFNQPMPGINPDGTRDRNYCALPQAAMRVAPTNLFLSDCGSVSIPMKTVEELGDQSPLTLFEKDAKLYKMNDAVHTLMEDEGHTRIHEYIRSQKKNVCLESPEVARLKLATDVMNTDKFLYEPENHRKALLEVFAQLKGKGDAIFYRFRHNALRPYIRSVLMEHPGAEEKLRSMVDSLHRIEENEALRVSESRQVSLSTQLMAKEALALFSELESLVGWAKSVSSDKDSVLNNFVFEQIHALLPEKTLPGDQRASVVDCQLLLRWVRQDPVSDAVYRSAFESMRSEKAVPIKELREHFGELKRKIDIFRSINRNDFNRENFYQVMEEQTCSVAKMQFRWCIASHALQPYSRTFVQPLIRLPEHWQSPKFTPLVQHAVLRSFETYRMRTSRMKYAKVERSIVEKGNVVIRRRGAESFLVLTEAAVAHTPQLTASQNVWHMRRQASIARFTGRDFLDILSDFEDNEIDIARKPLKDRQSIKVTIKRFREMFRDNRNALRQKLGIDPEEEDEEEPEHKKFRYDITKLSHGPDPIDIHIDSYRQGIEQSYRVHSARAGQQKSSLGEIHGKILKTAIRKNPANFSKLLMLKAGEDSILPDQSLENIHFAGVDENTEGLDVASY